MDQYEMFDEGGGEEEADLITPPSTENRPSLQEDERLNYQQYRRPAASKGWCSRRLPGVFLLSVAAAVVGSSTQFGYASGVLNSPQNVIRESLNNNKTTFTSLEMNVAVAIFAIGGLLGAVPAGMLADLLGRKYTLLFNNLLVFLGAGLQSLAVHPAMFIAGRFVVGLNSGVNTVLVPLYISEISPVKWRGAVGVLHQMAITVSLLLAQVLGIGEFLGRRDSEFYGWRILFTVPLLFSLVQLGLLPWAPRSPRFLLIKRKNPDAANRALQRLRGQGSDINEELQEMQAELESQQQRLRCGQFLTVPYLRRALMVSIALHLAQQLSGISGIIYYSTSVFRLAGVSNPDIATVAVGLVLVIVTLFTVFVIELLGRRTLMLYGLGGMSISFLFLTSMFCFQDGFYQNSSSSYATPPGVLLVIFSLTTVALFAIGPGSIPWLMVSELFLQEARPVAVGIATIVNWSANFTVGLTFPYILKYLYPYGTSVFVVTCGVLWVYLYRYLPETRGKSVEQVTAKLRRDLDTSV